jgi:hypothetical protein
VDERILKTEGKKICRKIEREMETITGEEAYSMR